MYTMENGSKNKFSIYYVNQINFIKCTHVFKISDYIFAWPGESNVGYRSFFGNRCWTRYGFCFERSHLVLFTDWIYWMNQLMWLCWKFHYIFMGKIMEYANSFFVSLLIFIKQILQRYTSIYLSVKTTEQFLVA